MKNQFSIIMFGLLALCASAVILLIIVVVMTGGHINISRLFSAPHEISQELSAEANARSAKDSIPIPEYFREIDREQETTVNDTAAAQAPDTAPAPAPVKNIQKYYSTFPCNQQISGNDLRQLFADNNIFCQKSRWSSLWANPAGKGLRRKVEGISFGDSVVVDSFTNLMWQRYASKKALPYSKTGSVIDALNSVRWQGYSDWRLPKIEEIMTTFTPGKNRAGLYLPSGWDCRASDVWSCNSATDSLNTRWIWVARTALGRCNVGHPDTARSLLAVRGM